MTDKLKGLTAWVAIILTLIGSLVGFAVWASDEHAESKEWAAEKDRVLKEDMQNENSKQFIPQRTYAKDITTLDERQQRIKEDVSEIKTIIKEIRDNLPRSWRDSGRNGNE